MKNIKYLFAALPLLEIAGFIIVGQWLGVIATLLLIVATTVLGFFIVRIQGFVTLANMQRHLSEGKHPAIDMVDGSLMMLGGVLLILPGFITDTLGLLLLIPPLRLLFLRWLIKHGAVMPQPPKPEQRTYYSHVIEDVEFHREDADNDDTNE